MNLLEKLSLKSTKKKVEKSISFPALTISILKNRFENISLESLLTECKFNSLNYSFKDFILQQDKFGYVSYVFNEKKSSLPGSINGLRVQINTSKLKDIGYKYAGLRLIVHNYSYDSGYYRGGSNENFNIINN